MTTVPVRRDNLLPETLRSLAAAGFDRPRLFVDGCEPGLAAWYGTTFGLDVTARNPMLRVALNWSLALAELFVRDPTAERFAVFQDDLLACRNLRTYLERCRYPDGPVNPHTSPGYWNLYTAPSNQALAQGEGWYLSNQLGRGAVALVFSREAVITLLSQRRFVERAVHPTRGWRSIDGGIVTALGAAGWKEYVHNPSLVGHMGIVSTIDKRKHTDGRAAQFPRHEWAQHLRKTSFRGEGYDPCGLLSNKTAV